VWCGGGFTGGGFTDNNTTPTKLFYFVLLVGLWQFTLSYPNTVLPSGFLNAD
jgi:hypothetical protein